VTELQTIADAVDLLTNPIRHTERIFDRDAHRNRRLKRVWVVTLPSLIDQLRLAMFPGEVYVEEQGHARMMPRSVPPARVEAVNALLQIEAGAAMWMIRSGARLRPTTTDNLRALVGLRGDEHALRRDVNRWYGWAATLTGWERPPFTPQAPCPGCGNFTLRVRLDRKTATCVTETCDHWWNEDTWGILAEHMRLWREQRKHAEQLSCVMSESDARSA
jgi:hypothetical protein